MLAKRICLILLVLALVAVTGCTTPGPAASPTPTATPQAATPTAQGTSPTALPSSPGAPTSASVTIKGFAFEPQEVTIAQGGTVTWTNDDSVTHTVKFAADQSPSLGNGGTYAKKFDSAGTFDYSCGIHPSMKGKVIVV